MTTGEKSALLVVDVQEGMFNETTPVYNGRALLQKIKSLINKARKENLEIIYVRHNNGKGDVLEFGKPLWEIHKDIYPNENEVIIDKTTPDSFYNTKLQVVLKKNGIKNLYIYGIQTEACVDTTCRRAFSLGYHVTLVADAHSTWDKDDLTASQIIHHHNDILHHWFVDLVLEKELFFLKIT